MDKVGQVGQVGQSWTIWTKLDKIGHFDQDWTKVKIDVVVKVIIRAATIEETDKIDETLQMVKGDEGRSIKARDDTRA